ncbi:hypothetical protein [Lysobacter enzymogenes]|nr:hypothetical protein [Lysobacter enzymogenes]
MTNKAMPALLLLLVSLIACAKTPMHPVYPKASVQPVSATRLADGEIRLKFLVPVESMYFASGVDYEVSGQTLRVTIVRCPIRGECSPMLRRATPVAADRIAEIRLPNLGARVVLVHADGEEQILP